MIPAPFMYHRPGDVAAAIALLAEHGDEARVIAGGHSLIPLMKQRMTDIAHLVDLGGVAGLAGVEIAGDTVRIGATTTQESLIGDAGLARVAPLIREAALQVADPQVRALGTIGGNVANGDPGNDMPAVMMCLDATFELAGPDGTRTVPAREFYLGPYETARADEEILTAMTFAARPGGTAYEKQKRKIGDYATAAAAVALRKDGDRCAEAAVAMTNLAPVPVFAAAAGEALAGTTVDAAAVRATVTAMQEAIDPAPDNRGPAEFKRHVAGVMLERAIRRAWARA